VGTGQVIERGFGLHDYGARHYAQPLGRWIAPDTIVPDPGNPQSLNRYSYVLSNPVKFLDPAGHVAECSVAGGGCEGPEYQPILTSGDLYHVKLFAEQYGLPWQVVAGVLEAELTLDTGLFDYYATAAVAICPFCMTLLGDIIGRDIGPGLGSIHTSTATSVSEYFAEDYGERSDVQLGLHDRPEWQVAWILTHDSYNIQTEAAYVRQFADYRFGADDEPLQVDHSYLGDWAITDAVAMWHGYRYGAPGVSPGQPQGWKEGQFQGAGRSVLGTATGLDATRSTIGGYRIMGYYLRQR